MEMEFYLEKITTSCRYNKTKAGYSKRGANSYVSKETETSSNKPKVKAFFQEERPSSSYNGFSYGKACSKLDTYKDTYTNTTNMIELQENSKEEKIKGRTLKFTSCLKQNWKNKVKNTKDSAFNKLISRLNFLLNNKINHFNLKADVQSFKKTNVNEKKNCKPKTKKKKKKSKAKKDKNQIHNTSHDLSNALNTVFTPKDLSNPLKINYNEFSSDIFLNSTDSSIEGQINQISTPDSTMGNLFSFNLQYY